MWINAAIKMDEATSQLQLHDDQFGAGGGRMAAV